MELQEFKALLRQSTRYNKLKHLFSLEKGKSKASFVNLCVICSLINVLCFFFVGVSPSVIEVFPKFVGLIQMSLLALVEVFIITFLFLSFKYLKNYVALVKKTINNDISLLEYYIRCKWSFNPIPYLELKFSRLEKEVKKEVLEKFSYRQLKEFVDFNEIYKDKVFIRSLLEKYPSENHITIVDKVNIDNFMEFYHNKPNNQGKISEFLNGTLKKTIA